MSRPDPGRRRFLRTVGATSVAALAGCSLGGTAPPSRTITPAPVPPDEPSPTIPPPPSADDVSFEVRALNGFTNTLPARLSATFRNTGDRLLTALGARELVLPFVDDDYAGLDGSGEFGLFLAPADTTLVIDSGDTLEASVGASHPDRRPDGCWTLPFSWSGARGASPVVMYAVTLAPSESVSHVYECYFIDECSPGTYTFEATLDLTNTDPPLERAVYRTNLGFDLTVTADASVAVDVHQPRIAAP